ncbi:unnamed protein product [Blepharisma stoltei]|uniref:Palmitoyltransferase n=1 Tax=Blepharisma stoltei TaxID=1481888 RepID=A0AAU9IK97_9CILI|nr:unnamed protein product [Blepharisma stoltei]
MKKTQRKAYHQWPGDNKFFCKGRIIMGPDYWRAWISFVLINVPATLFLTTTCVKLLEYEGLSFFLPLSLIFQLISISYMFITSTTDPGFLPRQEPPFSKGPARTYTIPYHIATNKAVFSPIEHKFAQVPHGSNLMKLKYCQTCMIVRPPRCSHCSECNVCVEKFDHHCPWIGNCVGKRNYKYFIIFLTSTSILVVINFVGSLLHLLLLIKDYDGKSDQAQAVSEALRDGAVSTFLAAYSFLEMWFLLGLCGFHMYLLFTNQTSSEQLKNTWKVPYKNPYRESCFANVVASLCKSNTPPHFNYTGPEAEDMFYINIVPSHEAYKLKPMHGKGDSEIEIQSNFSHINERISVEPKIM